jgi:nucleotide-binding universal stress UspA family protein
MSCYRTILVAIDGSPDAAAALRHAATLARDQNARLIALTVVPPPPPQLPSPGIVAASPAEAEDAYVRILRRAVDGLPPDVGVQTRIAHGRPAKAILEIAHETGCDLIVMGAHGHGRLHHALIGSTSDAVLRVSDLPVLLMRGGGAVEAEPDPASTARAASGG